MVMSEQTKIKNKGPAKKSRDERTYAEKQEHIKQANLVFNEFRRRKIAMTGTGFSNKGMLRRQVSSMVGKAGAANVWEVMKKLPWVWWFKNDEFTRELNDLVAEQ
jgi:hypothetical protein